MNLAAMGSAMARVLLGIERPTVGLLNIGVEEVKGTRRSASGGSLLREGQWPQFEYCGFVEGDDIGKGTVDVVVTEGFTGNIALKAAEGTARQLTHMLKRELERTLARKLGYLLARGAFRALSEKMDPRKSNGGVFLGLNGIVIKSHGGTDAEGFACAIESATTWCVTSCSPRSDRLSAGEGVPAPGPRAARGAWHRERNAFGRARLRQLSAQPGSDQCGASRMVDTSDEWITQRTGIRERHIAGEGETTADMALKAARAALDRAGVDAQSIDLIVLATSTPDNTFPASAVSVQAGLGITHGAAFDVQAVCSGFVYGLATVDGLLKTGAFRARTGDRC